MARYEILHRTTYRYAFPVSVSHHSTCLKPLTDDCQTCDSFDLRMNPNTFDLIERLDFFGNSVQTFSIQKTHEELVIDARSNVYCKLEAVPLEDFDTPCGAVRRALSDYSRHDLIESKQYAYNSVYTPDVPEVEAFGQRFINSAKPFGKGILEMLDAFAEEFKFDPAATEISTPVAKVLAERKGVCQDFAHLMLAALRSCGLAARYVSGYILTEPPEGQERLEGADASHAWVSVFLPEHGWIDVDPTNRLVCSDQHIKVAYGRDYSDISMIKGAVRGGGNQDLLVEVTVRPVD